jgi:hypothetical protein
MLPGGEEAHWAQAQKNVLSHLLCVSWGAQQNEATNDFLSFCSTFLEMIVFRF